MFLKNRKGAVFPLVLITLAVLSLLGTALIQTSIMETRLFALEQKRIQAYYNARAGADAMASYIIRYANQHSSSELVDEIIGLIGGTYEGIINDTDIDFSNPEFTIDSSNRDFDVEVLVEGGLQTGDPAPNEIKIQSTGYAKDNITAKTAVILRLSVDVFNYAVFSNQLFSFSGPCELAGDVGTNHASNFNLDSGTSIRGDLYVRRGVSVGGAGGAVEGSIIFLDEKITLPTINTGMFPPETGEPLPPEPIMTGGYYEDIVDPHDLQFNPSGGSLFVRVNTINLTQPGTGIRVIGSGDLHMLVTGSLFISPDTVIETSGNTRLFIYYNGIEPAELHVESFDVNFTLYAPWARVTLVSSTGMDIRGSVIARRVTLESINVRYRPGLKSFLYLFERGYLSYKKSQWSE